MTDKGTRSNSGLTEAFERFLQFSPGSRSAVRVFFAPGRVNLIGEHTDYNGGYVLPAALDMGTWLFARCREDQRLRISSTSFSQVVEVSTEKLRYEDADDYANYPKGVFDEFQKRGFTTHGFDLLFYGNIPNGAGLSSSASIEVVTAFMLDEVLSANLSRQQLALMSQAAENEFVGVNCGIMDQFAVAMGKVGHAISLNCDTLDDQLVSFNMRDTTLVIANTNKRRGLTDSKYNERRSECEAALRQLQAVRPNLKALADVEVEEWQALEPVLQDPVLKKRARHIVFENERAKQAVHVLGEGNTELFGQMMNESHRSLRDDYEVTGSELDALVEAAWSVSGCVGSRMTGAGFGGCTVSLVHTDKVPQFLESVREHYVAAIGYEPSFYVTGIGDGVKEVTREVVG